MQLLLQRETLTEKSTIGVLSVDEVIECFTLEDRMREIAGQSVESWKVPKETAIPVGSYDVVIDMSQRFKRRMMHVLGVPGFDGIRIHAGNTDADTEGCILVGRSRDTDVIYQSKFAEAELFAKVDAALTANETVRLTVQNPATMAGNTGLMEEAGK